MIDHESLNRTLALTSGSVVSLVMLAIGAVLLFTPGMVLRTLLVVNRNSVAAQKYVQRLERYGGKLRAAGAIAFGWGCLVAYLIVKALAGT